MKLIIDLPEEVVTAIQNGEDYRYGVHTTIAQGIPYEPKGDLISREALKKDLITYFPDKCLEGITTKTLFKQILTDINNVPTVKAYTDEELKKKYDEGRNDGYATCYDRYVRKNDEPFC